MLGFRGHFSTKSRRYSVTLRRLRRARTRFQRRLAGAGWDTEGDAELAKAAAARAREYTARRAENRQQTEPLRVEGE